MKHDWTADLLTYWDRLRGTRAAPDRRDVSPRDLASKLPNIFILRSDTDNAINSESANIPQAKQWQFRLAGTRLCTIYGRELRNTRFLSLWHEDVRSWLAEQLHLSGLDYRPLRLEHTSLTLNEKSCHFETLLLPLHESDGTLAWIGSMVALDQPLWLGSEPLISNHMGLATTPAQNNSLQTTNGVKSVLQVLLDRHHELSAAPQSAPLKEQPPLIKTDLTATGEAISYEGAVADTAFARALLPQIEALMPMSRPSDSVQHSVHAAPSACPAPLTVTDLIKSINPAAPQSDVIQKVSKAVHLKLISGGKDKS